MKMIEYPHWPFLVMSCFTSSTATWPLIAYSHLSLISILKVLYNNNLTAVILKIMSSTIRILEVVSIIYDSSSKYLEALSVSSNTDGLSCILEAKASISSLFKICWILVLLPSMLLGSNCSSTISSSLFYLLWSTVVTIFSSGTSYSSTNWKVKLEPDPSSDLKVMSP